MSEQRRTLRRAEILRGHGSFRRTLSEGTVLTSGFIRCFYQTRSYGRPHQKVGFAVSRSIQPAAVRNRVKRLMREAYRLNKRLLNMERADESTTEVVFLYTGRSPKEARRLQYRDVDLQVQRLLREIRRCGIHPK